MDGHGALAGAVLDGDVQRLPAVARMGNPDIGRLPLPAHTAGGGDPGELGGRGHAGRVAGHGQTDVEGAGHRDGRGDRLAGGVLDIRPGLAVRASTGP